MLKIFDIWTDISEVCSAIIETWTDIFGIGTKIFKTLTFFFVPNSSTLQIILFGPKSSILTEMFKIWTKKILEIWTKIYPAHKENYSIIQVILGNVSILMVILLNSSIIGLYLCPKFEGCGTDKYLETNKLTTQ